MPKPKNVLWIMCDQLRHDYLGCTGHPTLTTPNIDAMARRGVHGARRSCKLSCAQSSKVTLNFRPLMRPALRLCCAPWLTLLLTATYEK